MNMHISIPINLRLEQAALRILWLNFDHCSDYANTFQIHSDVEEIGGIYYTIYTYTHNYTIHIYI